MRLLREAPADRRSRITGSCGLCGFAQSGLEQDRQIMAGAKGIPDGCRYDRFPAV